MEISVKGFIVPKLNENFRDCHDRYAIDTENKRFAISDGISSSFFPAKWAEILVSNFVKEGWSNTFLDRCREQWKGWVDEEVNKEGVKFFTKQMYNRGQSAAATFIGLEITNSNSFSINIIGDSHLFHFAQHQFINKYSTSTEFHNYPDYFDSINGRGKGELVPYNELEFKGEDTFVLCTDAISKWVVENIDEKEKIQRFFEIITQEEYEWFIQEERSNNSLENDDCAVLFLQFTNNNDIEIRILSNNLTDIESKIVEEKDNKIEVIKDDFKIKISLIADINKEDKEVINPPDSLTYFIDILSGLPNKLFKNKKKVIELIKTKFNPNDLSKPQ